MLLQKYQPLKMSQQTIPQDLEQRLAEIDNRIQKSIDQGVHVDETKRNELVKLLEELFLAVPVESAETIHDQTEYLPFSYFDFYNTWFKPENAPVPEGCHFNDWIFNGTKGIEVVERNLSPRLNGILEEIVTYGGHPVANLLRDGIGSVAEGLRKRYGEEAAERYLLIIQSRFDQSFSERNLAMVRYLHEAETRGHSPIERRKQLNEIGRRFLGYIKQTFEFVNGLPALFDKVNPEFRHILFKEGAPITQTYQEFADFVVEANGRLQKLQSHSSQNKKYRTEELLSLLGNVEGQRFYKSGFLDNVVRLVKEEGCGDIPVLNCNSSGNLVYIKNSNITEISKESNCITLNAMNGQEGLIINRFMYDILDVI